MLVTYTKEQLDKIPPMTKKELEEAFERHKNDPEDPECPFVKPEEFSQFHRHYPKSA